MIISVFYDKSHTNIYYDRVTFVTSSFHDNISKGYLEICLKKDKHKTTF